MLFRFKRRKTVLNEFEKCGSPNNSKKHEKLCHENEGFVIDSFFEDIIREVKSWDIPLPHYGEPAGKEKQRRISSDVFYRMCLRHIALLRAIKREDNIPLHALIKDEANALIQWMTCGKGDTPHRPSEAPGTTAAGADPGPAKSGGALLAKFAAHRISRGPGPAKSGGAPPKGPDVPPPPAPDGPGASTVRIIHEKDRHCSGDLRSWKDYPPLIAELRGYRLATTDLFVEKAIRNLELDTDDFYRKGSNAFRRALYSILLAIGISATTSFPPLIQAPLSVLGAIELPNPDITPPGESPSPPNDAAGSSRSWHPYKFLYDHFYRSPHQHFSSLFKRATEGYRKHTGYRIEKEHEEEDRNNQQLTDLSNGILGLMKSCGSNKDCASIVQSSMKPLVHALTLRTFSGFLSHFVASFTFYGFLVLFSVTQWRYGRALMDQAERLRQKRHALRQGRLFVHLRDGELTIDELEKAFSWNLSTGNAFGNIPTEASAPWGGVFKDAVKMLSDRFKPKE